MESAPNEGQMVNTKPSPFVDSNSTNKLLPTWAHRKYLQTPPNIDLFRSDFMSLGSDTSGLVTGAQIKSDFVRVSGLPSSVLHR